MRLHLRPSSVALLLLLAACSAATEGVPDDPPLPASSAAASVAPSSLPASRAPAASSAAPRSSARPATGEIPAQVNLDVPFTSQAPHANWNDPYQEACEEAALLMAIAYRNGTGFTPATADAAILDLVAWETERGYAQDVNAEEMARIVREKFGMNARVRYDVSAESIKEELASGNPVVIPAAGRDLGNPYFSGEGPWYHALVIRGYRAGWTGGDIFVTNDPGTRRGEGYEYDADVLVSAIHDWTGVKEEIRSGRKAMVIVEP